MSQESLFAVLRRVLGAPDNARFTERGFAERHKYRHQGAIASLLRKLSWRLPPEWSDGYWFHASDAETFRVKTLMVPRYMTDGQFAREDIRLDLCELLVNGEAYVVNAGYGPVSNLVVWGVKSDA